MRNGALRAFAVAAGLLICAAAVAQNSELVFVNDTGATIYYLYVSPTTADSWGEDLLGNAVLPDGGSFRARMRPSPAFDLRAVDSSENEYIVWNWSAGRDSQLVIGREAFVGVSHENSGAALAWLNIRNETHYTIVQVVAISANSGDWEAGERLLKESEAIHDGEAYRVEIDVERSTSLIFDIMLIDEDGDRYIKRNVNLEIVGELVCTLDDLLLR